MHERESLIILDEIQLFPQARQAVKTLLEDGRYDILETGSLASITKRSKEILIPSEEYTLEVLPMDFEEFLWAQGDQMTVPLIRRHYETMKPLKDLHRPIMKSFREYMMVGGMPQAVKMFVESRDYGKVDLCQVILEMTPTSTKELPPPLQGKKSAKGGSAIENSLFYRDSIARELFDNI